MTVTYRSIQNQIFIYIIIYENSSHYDHDGKTYSNVLDSARYAITLIRPGLSNTAAPKPGSKFALLKG